MKLAIAKLQRLQFGRRSEKLDREIEQLELRLEELQVSAVPVTPHTIEKPAPQLHADDTPVPVLDPGRGRTKTGRLWTYVRDDRPAGSNEAAAVLFRYAVGRTLAAKPPFCQRGEIVM